MRWAVAVGLALAVTVTGWTDQEPWTEEAEADLNGDGTVEQIRLERLERRLGAFTLHVDGVSITDKLTENLAGLRVVDIDGWDEYREIEVHTYGPSDDPAAWYFWYNGTELHRMGKVGGSTAIGPGGSVYGSAWMGFWSRTSVYRLNRETHRLEQQPRDFHLVDLTVAVRSGHPIYRTRKLEMAAGQMQPGSEVTIVACDCRGDYGEWRYLVVLPDDTTGWLSDDQIVRNLEVSLAD
ncbi:MAG: hypothetical protein ACP5KN_10560 [Armatimonadota bacterium]